MESPAVAAHPLRLSSTFFLSPMKSAVKKGETKEMTLATTGFVSPRYVD
jgi:hypothetical protein